VSRVTADPQPWQAGAKRQPGPGVADVRERPRSSCAWPARAARPAAARGSGRLLLGSGPGHARRLHQPIPIAAAPPPAHPAESNRGQATRGCRLIGLSIRWPPRRGGHRCWGFRHRPHGPPSSGDGERPAGSTTTTAEVLGFAFEEGRDHVG